MATATTTLVSVEEYLSTSYKPDVEFKNGELIGRNVGTQQHGTIQFLIGLFFAERTNYRIKQFVEVRLLLNAETGRHVVPDVMVVERPYTKGRVVVDVPAIVVEVKSPEDRFDEIIDKCFEYAAAGIPNIVVIDPDSRRQAVFANNALQFVGPSITLHLPQADVDLVLLVDEIFARLDADENDAENIGPG
jgi:Uma2 family endonuclease